MALIDGVRDRFINSLTNTNQPAMSKRSFSVNTEIVKELLEEFLTDYLDLYLPKRFHPDINEVRSALYDYLFTDSELEDILDEYSLYKKDFDTIYSKLHKGFTTLYEEDYI